MILGDEHGLYGSTSNGTLLESVPLGLATSTVPVVAPAECTRKRKLIALVKGEGRER